MGKLDGKIAVITGGSSGMALASARLFVDEGAHVFISGRRQDALDWAVADIGRNVTAIRGDAANLDDLDQLFDTVTRAAGRIDVLFASAGTAPPAPLVQVTEDHFDQVFGLNARGTLFTVQKALPLLTDGASIILTGTVVAASGWPGLGVYAASKAALRAYAGTWIHELKHRRIRVNVLSPGTIATPAQDERDDETTRQQLAASIPRGTIGTPEEVASVALFLASSDSAFVSGHELTVDGGATAL